MGMVAAVETQKTPEQDFEEIYKAHYRRVLNLCRYLLNSPEKAEDAAHEVFLRAHARLDTYNPALPLSSWLLKIASNYCIDVLRRGTTERRIFAENPGEHFDPPSRNVSPLSEVLAAERAQDVRAAVDSLGDKYRVPASITRRLCEPRNNCANGSEGRRRGDLSNGVYIVRLCRRRVAGG